MKLEWPWGDMNLRDIYVTAAQRSHSLEFSFDVFNDHYVKVLEKNQQKTDFTAVNKHFTEDYNVLNRDSDFLKGVNLQCISQHGCTSGRSPSQRRCKQSCHGKTQPGSFHLKAQKGQNWNSAETLMTVQLTLVMFYLERTWYWKWSHRRPCA